MKIQCYREPRGNTLSQFLYLNWPAEKKNDETTKNLEIKFDVFLGRWFRLDLGVFIYSIGVLRHAQYFIRRRPEVLGKKRGSAQGRPMHIRRCC